MSFGVSGFRLPQGGLGLHFVARLGGPIRTLRGALSRVSRWADTFTLNKLECLKQAAAARIPSAWNNGIGPRFYFVGFRNPRGNDQ